MVLHKGTTTLRMRHCSHRGCGRPRPHRAMLAICCRPAEDAQDSRFVLTDDQNPPSIAFSTSSACPHQRQSPPTSPVSMVKTYAMSDCVRHEKEEQHSASTWGDHSLGFSGLVGFLLPSRPGMFQRQGCRKVFLGRYSHCD